MSGAVRRTKTVCEFISRRKRLLAKRNKRHLVIIASEVVRFAVFSAGRQRADTHTNRYSQRIERDASRLAQKPWFPPANNPAHELYRTAKKSVKKKAYYSIYC
jgi:hypothetical protein